MLSDFVDELLAVEEVPAVLKGSRRDVLHGLPGEECLVGGDEHVGVAQEERELVIGDDF